MANENATDPNAQIVVRSDEELVSDFCLANKVSDGRAP